MNQANPPSSEKPIRIGITGASGFIGSHLHQALLQKPEIEVEPLTRQPSETNYRGENLKSFVYNKDCIYHIGGVNRASDENLLLGNIMNTLKLLSAVKQYGRPEAHIIFASSTQVYGTPQSKIPFRESQACRSESVYGSAKKTAEDLIRFSGLDYTILRMSNVYGPGCRPQYNSVVATFCYRAVQGQTLQVHGDGKQGRDFIFVSDVVDALLRAGWNRLKVRNKVYNVSSGRIRTLKNILDQIRKSLPDTVIERQPAEAAPPQNICFDSAKFQKHVSWKPRIPWTEGIRQTINGFQNSSKG